MNFKRSHRLPSSTRLKSLRARDALDIFFELSHDAIMITDDDGSLLFINEAASTLFGQGRDALLSQGFRFSGSANHATEIHVLTPEGIKTADLNVIEFDWPEPGSRLICIQDTTTAKRIELQLLMSERMISLGTLVASVAHEINNPLAAAIGNLNMAVDQVAKLARRQPIPNELLEQLEDTQEATNRIRKIVNDLKLLSRADIETRDPVDVEDVLESTLRIANCQIWPRARLVKDYSSPLPVLANEPRLAQVFLNLVVNAVQAIPPGNPAKNEVRIATSSNALGDVDVTISDTGTGIRPDVAARLFEPFFSTKEGNGTGLGLSISRQIIESFGGSLHFETQLGKGTQFHIRLPAAPQGVSAISVPPTELKEPRVKVLIIDDESMLLEVLQRRLMKDFDVTTTWDAEEALCWISEGWKFDVVLCDITMPGMSGPQFYRCSSRDRRGIEQARLVHDWKRTLGSKL